MHMLVITWTIKLFAFVMSVNKNKSQLRQKFETKKYLIILSNRLNWSMKNNPEIH